MAVTADMVFSSFVGWQPARRLLTLMLAEARRREHGPNVPFSRGGGRETGQVCPDRA